MIRIILAILLYLTTLVLGAQEKDSDFKKEATKGLQAEFPSFRPFNFEFGNSFGRDFDSELFGSDFQDGELTGQRTFKAIANLPFYRTKKTILTASLDYSFNEFTFEDVTNVSPTSSFRQNETLNFHNFKTALSATRFSTLFKKPIIYNASAIVDGNQEGFQRFKGLIGATVVMKRTENTSITLGAIWFIDPTSQIPFVPTFTYNHKFKNSVWEFDFILPRRLLFRRPVGTKGRLSLGSTFGGNGFYVNVDSPNLPDVFEYSQLEIKTGFTYERQLSSSVIATFNAGMANFVSSRLTEKGRPTRDFIYSNGQGGTGYFNIGVSYNPFVKMMKRKKTN